MFELLNEMPELIYIADIETYELQFINNAGRKKFHINGPLDGLKCHKVLQGLDVPCSFCTNNLLSFDKVYSWEITNLLTSRHYLLKDMLVDWHGRKSHMEIAFDNTDSENEKIELKNMLDAEKMVMECAKQLYQMEDISKSVQGVLELVGTFLSADRVYIFDILGNEMSNTYEWCAKGIEPEIESLQHMDVAVIDNWMPHFNLQECEIIIDVETLKDTEPEVYQVLSRQGISSLVTAPLEKDGKLSGFLGVDNPPAEKIRNIASLFHTLRFFLMAALRRAEDEKLLARLSYYDTLTGFYNRNRFIRDTNELSDYKETIGIAYLDINGLKDINDKQGHSYGDNVLFLCARKIAEEFERGDFYRIGGDEFVVLCKLVTEKQFLKKIERLKKRFAVDEDCNVAIGYQWVKSVGDMQALVAKTDALMYEDKKAYYHRNPPSHRYRQWE